MCYGSSSLFITFAAMIILLQIEQVECLARCSCFPHLSYCGKKATNCKDKLHVEKQVRAGLRFEWFNNTASTNVFMASRQVTEETVSTTDFETLLRVTVELCQSASSVSVLTVENGKQLLCAAFMNDKMLHYYTGLESYAKLESVLATQGRAAYRLVYYNKATPVLSVANNLLQKNLRKRAE